MKAITANALQDGAVVYLGDDDQWTPHLSSAARFEDGDAKDVLAAACSRIEEITEAYLISVDDSGAIIGRETIRETIRKGGPTVRLDLGLQAESCG